VYASRLVFLWISLGLALGGRTQDAVTSDPPFDLLVRGGRIIDGTGAPWFVADVGVRAGRIAAVGTLGEPAARRVIDATGLYVAPGFIDLLGQSEYHVLVDPRAASKITQGITTEVTGEGQSIAPVTDAMLADQAEVHRRYGYTPEFRTLAGYFTTLEQRGTAINIATFVGAGGVRDCVIGKAERRPTTEELARMCALVDEAMRDGALGLSSALQYVPDMYASTDELVALAKVAAKYGGAYFTHQRSESNAIDSSLDEVFAIAKQARIRTHVWHLKTAYRGNWGEMPKVLARIAEARTAGLDVAANQYPYTAAANGLDACLPPWVREGGREQMLERLRDPALRARAKADLEVDSDEWSNQYLGAGGAEGVLVASVVDASLADRQGKTIAELAAAAHQDPRDALIDLVVADHGHSGCITFIMDEADVRAALRSPIIAFCTDSGARATDGVLSRERSHPRGFGSAARILGHYVRDERVLGLEEAVRKMTSFGAAAAGLADRGLVKVGFAADLVVFDLGRVREKSTYQDPLQYSEGFAYVAVNGALVVDGGEITAARPGRALRGPGWRRP